MKEEDIEKYIMSRVTPFKKSVAIAVVVPPTAGKSHIETIYERCEIVKDGLFSVSFNNDDSEEARKFELYRKYKMKEKEKEHPWIMGRHPRPPQEGVFYEVMVEGENRIFTVQFKYQALCSVGTPIEKWPITKSWRTPGNWYMRRILKYRVKKLQQWED